MNLSLKINIQNKNLKISHHRRICSTNSDILPDPDISAAPSNMASRGKTGERRKDEDAPQTNPFFNR